MDDYEYMLKYIDRPIGDLLKDLSLEPRNVGDIINLTRARAVTVLHGQVASMRQENARLRILVARINKRAQEGGDLALADIIDWSAK